MRKSTIISLLLGLLISLSGCGDFEFFPDTTSGGPSPVPPPPGGTVSDVQADTVVKFLPYTVAGLADAGTTTAIRVSGHPTSQYAVNGGTPTNATVAVKNGDTIVVQNVSSNLGQKVAVGTVLVVGGSSATYTSITGTLIFPTLNGVGTGTAVTSNSAQVPTTLPDGFVFGTSTTIAFAPDSAPGSLMFINGGAFPAASPSPLAAGNTLTFRHTAAQGSGQTVTSKAVITGSNGVTYTVTFKSTTQ
jgi:hypothetical protein